MTEFPCQAVGKSEASAIEYSAADRSLGLLLATVSSGRRRVAVACDSSSSEEVCPEASLRISGRYHLSWKA